MKKYRSMIIILMFVCLLTTGCHAEKKQKEISIRIKCPPMTMAYDADHPNAEIYDLFQEAADKFTDQYQDANINFMIEKFQYVDEKEQVVDKIGTEEAPDILFGGSFNIPTYILKNQLAPWDDIITEELRSDIDDKVWKQCMADGKTYLMPYTQLQNTLLVNAKLMKNAGLETYIPPKGEIAHWSTKELNLILQELNTSTKDNDFTFPLFGYASNNQGDLHIMTLLRAYGCPIFDENGNFAINTPEGIQALKWLKHLNEQEITPKGAENMELLDNMELFFNGQLAICIGNEVTLNDCANLYQLDVFLANFPSLDGNGYATSYLNGFTLFDNGDEDKLSAAREFIRFIYSDEKLMHYALSSTPVNKSLVQKHKKEGSLIEAYSNNSSNIVDFLNNTPNWEGVRSVFYLNIQDLLRGTKEPEEVARAIDLTCNAAIEEGRRAAKE